MRELSLFDLHCDTLYETLKQNKSLVSNDLDLSFERLSAYRPFCQVLAMWSDWRLSEDAAYERFFAAREKLGAELAKAPSVALCTSAAELSAAEKSGKNAVFLAVEGGKLLNGDLTRLDALHENGVRFLTLVWDKVCCVGGAHDTDEGLTPFGFDVVKKMFSLGMIPDVSHASVKMTEQVVSAAEENGRVCIATHSNSRAVCAHSRNLSDDHFKRIAALGGLVGISMAPMHLTSAENCTVDDVIRHIEHYLSLDGEDTVCFGCDFDGVSRLPEGVETASDLVKIADRLGQLNYNDSLIEKIFYSNARNFIFLWLK